MIQKATRALTRLLRWSEKYTKTDMVYLAAGGFWVNANFLIVSIFSMILSIAFGNLISKESYGTYQYLFSIYSLLAAFTLTGMNTAITRSVAQGYEGTVKLSIPIQLKYNLLATLISFAFAVYYAIHGNIPFALAICVLGLLTPLFTSFNTYTSLISGKKDFRGGFLAGIALALPYTSIMFISLFFIKNPILLVLINVLINTSVTIILYIYSINYYKPNTKIDSRTISYGKHLSIANIITTIAGQADNLLVFHIIGPAGLAIYVFASTVPERINSLFKGINTIAFPKLSVRNLEVIRSGLLSKSIRFGLLTLMTSLFYVVLAHPLYHVLFPHYESSVIYSQAYSIALVFMSLASLPITALSAIQAQKQIYWFNTVSSIISILFMVIGTIYYGIWGLIFARAIAGIVNYLFILYIFPKESTSI